MSESPDRPLVQELKDVSWVLADIYERLPTNNPHLLRGMVSELRARIQRRLESQETTR